jgi:two-component system chemotaxis sensor kinase CheA
VNDEYLDTFVRESEEGIVELNNSLLDLEDDPTDREAIDLIFRTAHTLKGNFGAMGFQDGASLAHAIEDLLDEIREGRIEATAEVMDLIFEGVDEIESILAEVEAEGESTTDPTETIEELREVIEEEASDDDSEGGSVVTDGEGDAAQQGGLDELVGSGDLADVEGDVYRVYVEMGGSDMKGVDAMLVIEGVSGTFELHGCVPPRERIEEGEYEAGFDLLLEAEETADVDAFFGDLAKVETADVVAVAPEELGGSDGTGEDDPDDDVESVGDGISVDEIKSIRVDVDQLDDLYSLVEQLVTSRIKLRRSIEGMDESAASDNLDELDKITANLQDTVMDMRLIPLRKVVNTFPRLVRDLARSQDKQVDFSMEGTDIELDRTILDEISDPLMHVLRNAVDHGIEPPEEREAAGKPPKGTIRLSASRQRDHVDVEVEDDGAGLDPDVIREKAAEKGVRSESEIASMEDEEVYDLIFHPGFSTTEEVTDVSGRGVGMDVVNSTVRRLDGSVSVSSSPGEGTTVTLRLPVTVAIVRVLFIEVADRVFGLPIKSIDEITRAGSFETVNGREVIDHDDVIYPVLDLRERLTDATPVENGDGMLLRIRESDRPVALRCNAVGRREEVVVKPLEGELKDVPGMSGTAVVGDGRVVPIIDVVSL